MLANVVMLYSGSGRLIWSISVRATQTPASCVQCLSYTCCIVSSWRVSKGSVRRHCSTIGFKPACAHALSCKSSRECGSVSGAFHMTLLTDKSSVAICCMNRHFGVQLCPAHLRVDLPISDWQHRLGFRYHVVPEAADTGRGPPKCPVPFWFVTLCACSFRAVQSHGGVHHSQSIREQWQLLQAAETAAWKLQSAGASHVACRIWGIYGATLLLHKGWFWQGVPSHPMWHHACIYIKLRSALPSFCYSIRHLQVCRMW
jgi:hypothetical protein